jgi:hypothetical protein
MFTNFSRLATTSAYETRFSDTMYTIRGRTPDFLHCFSPPPRSPLASPSSSLRLAKSPAAMSGMRRDHPRNSTIDRSVSDGATNFSYLRRVNQVVDAVRHEDSSGGPRRAALERVCVRLKTEFPGTPDPEGIRARAVLSAQVRVPTLAQATSVRAHAHVGGAPAPVPRPHPQTLRHVR